MFAGDRTRLPTVVDEACQCQCSASAVPVLAGTKKLASNTLPVYLTLFLVYGTLQLSTCQHQSSFRPHHPFVFGNAWSLLLHLSLCTIARKGR